MVKSCSLTVLGITGNENRKKRDQTKIVLEQFATTTGAGQNHNKVEEKSKDIYEPPPYLFAPLIRVEIRGLIDKAKEELKQLEKERGDIDSTTEEKLTANAAAQATKTKQIADLQRQLDYFEWPAWKGPLYDLLTEKDTGTGVVSFHRFQIFVWTIVLGIMFVANVYDQLAMPQFSATLLGLLGISAGTYVGFKIPESNKTKESA